MRSGLLLLLVVLALAALAALLWWRFMGSGQSAAAPTSLLASRNHYSLRSFHYELAGAAQKAALAVITTEAGSALAQLLPEEDLVQAASDPAEEAEEHSASATDTGENAEPAELEAAADQTPRPASIRHAAGAVASLLDALDDAPAAELEPVADASEPAPETDEEPAPALYFNPLTAPAPTANDQANRAAEIALRQQRRARMSTNAAAQRAALSGLFPGAGTTTEAPPTT
jgi:hypothetical protein